MNDSNVYTYNNAVNQHPHTHSFDTINQPPIMKKSSKKITFNKRVRVRKIASRSSQMSPDDKARIYYSISEMREFQQDVKDICNNAIQKARSLSATNPKVSAAENLQFLLESDASLRGLEIQLCPLRKRNKALVNQAVHTYYRQLQEITLLTPQQRELTLANACAQLNHLSHVQAVEMAKKDAAQVNKQHDRCHTPVSITPASTHMSPNIVSPVAVHAKRTLDLVASNENGKRRRISRVP